LRKKERKQTNPQTQTHGYKIVSNGSFLKAAVGYERFPFIFPLFLTTKKPLAVDTTAPTPLTHQDTWGTGTRGQTVICH